MGRTAPIPCLDLSKVPRNALGSFKVKVRHATEMETFWPELRILFSESTLYSSRWNKNKNKAINELLLWLPGSGCGLAMAVCCCGLRHRAGPGRPSSSQDPGGGACPVPAHGPLHNLLLAAAAAAASTPPL